MSALLAVVLLAQAQPAWNWQVDITDAGIRNFPADLEWIDRAADGPVARVVTTSNTPRFELTDFFNREIDQVFLPDRPVGFSPVRGKTCVWTANTAGAMTFGPGCGRAPRTLYLDDDFGKLTLHDQRVLAQKPDVGRIVRVTTPPPARPRIKALVYVPCSPRFGTAEVGGLAKRSSGRICPQPLLSGQFYLDEPARMVMTWRGGTEDNQLQVGNKLYDIPAGRLTKVPLDIPEGNNPFQLQLPWSDPPPASPGLVSMTLTDKDGRTELLY
jgi:hypothetical protein